MDPLERALQWLEQAKQNAKIKEPTAMAVATSDAQGAPSVRMVLLKQIDAKGAVFYTNNGSQKGEELMINPKAALCFYWMPMERQMRIIGDVTPVSNEEADEYFASRKRGSQIGAWASHQSQPLETYAALLEKRAAIEAEYEGKEIPRPPYWSGWRVSIKSLEFWQEGEFRLHQRERYTREAKGWKHQWLNP